MSNVLYIKCNMKDADSSRTLGISDHFVKKYREANPDANITELDLYTSDIPGIDKTVFDAWGALQKGGNFQDLSGEQKGKLSRINELTEQFIGADRYIFSFPMYNLSCPSEIKKYIDNVTIVGKTFKYTEKGPIGLLSNAGRKAVVISTYGGFHFGNSDDFCTPYVKSLLNFLGIEDVNVLVADGIDAIPAKTEAFLEAAKTKLQNWQPPFNIHCTHYTVSKKKPAFSGLFYLSYPERQKFSIRFILPTTGIS